MADPGITIIVPTLNRGSVLRDCLQDLLAQRHRPIEILVVDQSDAVSPAVTEIVQQHPDLISYHRVSFRGLPLARNYGWQRARYDVILFVDDDIRCGPDFASEHLRTLQMPGVAVVAGGIDEAAKPPDLTSPMGRFHPWTGLANRGFGATGQCEVEHAPGGNFSVWREVIRSVGGFDEALNAGAALCEELDFCLRVRKSGKRIYFNGAARLTHLSAPGGGCRVPDVHERVYALTHNHGLLIRRHVSFFRRPVALARLGLIGLAFAWYYRSPSVVIDAIGGCWNGLRDGGETPLCTAIAQ